VDAGWRVLFAFQRPWPRATLVESLSDTARTVTMNQPSQSSVEEIVSQLTTRTAEGQSFELWIPQRLTLLGHIVPEPIAMAAITAKVLGMGYEPRGSTQGEGGRVFTFTPRG
jgi:hypothetical protein